jgi:hypothetical protein
MKNWNSVEEKWREQLQNKSDDIPEGLWSRLEERLEEKPSRRFPIYWAAAAMFLLALGLSWNWNSAPEQVTSEETTVVAKTEKTDVPVEKIAASISEPLIVPNKASESTFTKASAKPTSEVESSVATVIQESPKEEIVATTPVIEKKDESPEILTVRLDINPIVEEELKPAFVQQKRRKSLFGKIVGEIRHALDGEPVNWQKLKEGNTSFENSIHTVANTYVKTEENLKRTLQLK